MTLFWNITHSFSLKTIPLSFTDIPLHLYHYLEAPVLVSHYFRN